MSLWMMLYLRPCAYMSDLFFEQMITIYSIYIHKRAGQSQTSKFPYQSKMLAISGQLCIFGMKLIYKHGQASL